MITEKSLVVLDCHPPHERLKCGDVGTVVHAYSDARGYEVEFVDGRGNTGALITVSANDVRPIGSAKAGVLPEEVLWRRAEHLRDQKNEPFQMAVDYLLKKKRRTVPATLMIRVLSLKEG